MADRVSSQSEVVLIQLATKVPKNLHHRVRLHCVRTDTTVMAFVISALKDKLVRERRRKSHRMPALSSGLAN